MGIPCGIDHDAFDLFQRRLADAADESSFGIRLKADQFKSQSGGTLTAGVLNIRKCIMAVDLRLPASEKAQIGTVDQQ